MPLEIRSGLAGVRAGGPPRSRPAPTIGPARTAPARPAGAARPNPIILWLEGKGVAMSAFLSHLRACDRGLREALGNCYNPRDPGRRLVASLFLEYAHDQDLALGETAMLMTDPAGDAAAALRYILLRVAAERGAGRGAPCR